MRPRYFSPEIRETIERYKSKEQSKLRWMGSQMKLASPSLFEDCSEQTIGPYTYCSNKEIGSGYSSKVYKGRKLNSSADYAIKIIDLKKYSNSNIEMLSNEIEILKSLNHPNVLKCYDVYKTTTQCFIVTDFCAEGDLLKHLTKKGRLSEKDSLEIISQVIKGYKYLISQSIIHRDLKPANILKSGKVWKIADFGFAIRSDNEMKSKYNVGTPLYMPPEALVENIYSYKSDIFSIGIILYELVVGNTPWESKTEKDLIKKMLSVPFKIPDKCVISYSLKRIIGGMCQIKIKRRMDKKEFLDLCLESSESVENPEERVIRSEKSLDHQEISSRISYKSNEALPRLMRLVSSKSTREGKDDFELRKQESLNNELLICQLHYCRFLYYMVRNIGCFLIERKQGQKLGLIIFTHLLKLVKLIADPNVNCLKLKDWENFKSSKKYLNTYLTIKEYSLRYEKEYMTYLKFIDLDVLQEVNEMFVEMNQVNVLGLDFYTKLTQFIRPLLRAFNHNLGNKLMGLDGILDKEESGQIEALKCLYKYYKLIEICCNNFENYEYFEENCHIKVNVDFKKSGSSVESFTQLRRELKEI